MSVWHLLASTDSERVAAALPLPRRPVVGICRALLRRPGRGFTDRCVWLRPELARRRHSVGKKRSAYFLRSACSGWIKLLRASSGRELIAFWNLSLASTKPWLSLKNTEL